MAKQFTPDKIEFDQYQCQKCGCFWYMNSLDKFRDFDFGCPQGCDDAGKHTRTILVKTLEVKEVKNE